MKMEIMMMAIWDDNDDGNDNCDDNADDDGVVSFPLC